ncbi:hypothetical protein Gotri_011528 [Gossypium trilobum]|uniref:Reverse transcriptase zinc-binding domain-containing protein n=1 Tax=Gossypium trilobum TaxID=34281 RepID=A0A7J9EVP1_9ROSI|nr:hypothetical protein [Gossypium trilobum]
MPTLANLRYKKIVVDTLCPRCRRSVEDFVHMFQDCLITIEAWVSLNFSWILNNLCRNSREYVVRKRVKEALREWVGENVTGHSSKPVTITPNASNEGLLSRWGSFSPPELARLKELLKKPVRLKPGTVRMSKKEFEQRWVRKPLREMLSAIEERVGKLEKSMEDAKESDNALGKSIENLREQSRDFVTMCLTFQRDSMQELLNEEADREERCSRSHGKGFE